MTAVGILSKYLKRPLKNLCIMMTTDQPLSRLTVSHTGWPYPILRMITLKIFKQPKNSCLHHCLMRYNGDVIKDCVGIA